MIKTTTGRKSRIVVSQLWLLGAQAVALLGWVEGVLFDVDTRTRSCAVASGNVYKSGGTWHLQYHNNLASLTRVSTGVFTVQVSSALGTDNFSGVHVTPVEFHSDSSILMHWRASITPNPGGLVTVTFRDASGVALDPTDAGFWLLVNGVW